MAALDRAVDAAEDRRDEDHRGCDEHRVAGDVAGDLALVTHGSGRQGQRVRLVHGFPSSSRAVSAWYR